MTQAISWKKLSYYFFWPIACVQLLATGAAFFPVGFRTASMIGLPVLFVFGVGALELRAFRGNVITLVRRSALICAVSAAGFVSLAWIAGGDLADVLSLTSSIIFLGALAEEVVFRVIVPRGIASAVSNGARHSRSLIIGQVLSQLAFAICHLLPQQHLGRAELIEAIRLFAAGLMYASIYTVTGLPFAIAIHATLNETVIHVTSHATSERVLPWLILATLLWGLLTLLMCLTQRATRVRWGFLLVGLFALGWISTG